MITVISHFYNEEFLLPFWLHHHLRIFDHGILIDYASTDASVDIIKQMAPNWEIRQSRNAEFSAGECDAEVVDIENTLSGWKIALNTTEFILYAKLKELCFLYEELYPNLVGFRTHGVTMIDSIDEAYSDIIPNIPLFFQRTHGILDTYGPRGRLLHHAKNGNYEMGRHKTFHTNIQDNLDVFCLWFGWSPFRYVIDRKLQIQTRIPQKDKDLGLGIEHIISQEDLIKKFEVLSATTENLMDNITYRQTISDVYKFLYPEIKLRSLT